jgi:uncharacterized protein YdaU (DUF1376 family)
VKFYKRFPGDIQIKTGGLSMAEFGAYDRLLDHYYATEMPIERVEVYSIARAMSKSDREAVDKVLIRYFDVDVDGNYTQERADEMIAEAQPKIAAAKENGKLGGRPKGSGKKPSGLIPETQEGTETGDFEKASQSQNKKELSKPSASHPLSGGFAEFWLAWPKNERKQDKAKCLELWRRRQLSSIADGIVADVRVKRGTEKWQEGFVEAPLVYLRGRRWEDGVEPNEPNEPKALTLVHTTPPAETAAEYTARIARENAAREAERAAMLTPEAKAARDAALAMVKGRAPA